MSLNRLYILFLILHVFSCSGESDRQRRPDSGGPERRGTSVDIIELAYYDSLPAISADGQTAVFISGRNGVRQAFKRIIGTTTSPQRILTDDAGEELEVAISPDASFAMIVAFHNGEFTLYAKSLTSSAKAIVIKKDSQSKSHLSIAPDSKHFTFAERTATTQQLSVGSINLGTKESSVSTLGEEGFFNPLWVKAELNNLQILAQKRAENIGVTDLFKFTFTDLSTAEGAQPELLTSEPLAENGSMVSGENNAYFINDIYGQGEIKTRPSSGDIETPQNVNILSDPLQINLSTKETTEITPAGFRTRSLSTNSSGDLLVLLSQERIECEGEKVRFGSIMYLYNTADKSFTMLLPQLNAETSEWSVEKEMKCKPKPSEGEEPEALPDFKRDDKIIMANINADASPNTYSIIYETRFSPQDGKFGDREIMLLQKTDQGMSVKMISENTKSEN